MGEREHNNSESFDKAFNDRTTHHFLKVCENGSYFYYTKIKLSNKQKKQAFYLIYKARTFIIIAHNYCSWN